MKTCLVTFDRKAKELATVSSDPKFILAEIKKVLPSGYELEMMVPYNVQKYIKTK